MSEIIAETTSGPVQGRVKDDVLLFAGIPYAAAPIGDRRFKSAVPPISWEAVRAATKFGPAAPQIPSGGMTDNAPVQWNEDCLFLNVCTPALDGQKRPVLFWIHGGGYRTGQGAIPWYNGHSFARNGDIVVVSINYRMGIFGFTDLSRFGADYATSGINGILDQIVALQWVKNNIAAFGGDPDQVTIAGESAGAFAVSTLLGSPRAEGLFKRAIPQSGGAQHTLSAESGEMVTDHLLAEMASDQIEPLLAASAEELLEVQGRIDRAVQRGDLSIGSRLSPFYPVEGSAVLPVSPLKAIQDGSSQHVDVLIGSNKDEASLFIMKEVSADKLAGEVAGYGGGAALLEPYRARLPGANSTELSIALSTDYSFRIPAIRLAEARDSQDVKTWMYLFNWESRLARLKATYALEIPFVFNNLDKPGVDAFVGPGESPQPLADVMHAAWTGFIREGSPGWTAFDLERRTTMCFDTVSTTQQDPDKETRKAWHGLR